ncbi:putative photosynthetic complex assembly protein PuhE [Thioalkalicoccus limnaeus]|uniref:Photosynthetic complex assembly protein PuhE n=1 Tax=Thioalkalicoccus limnaeus TaxID=120681 RepID=A0ABV4BHF3_9GAMM
MLSQYLAPLLFALFVWWFSTGVVLYLNRLPRQTYPWSMLGATLLLTLSLFGLVQQSANASVTSAYLAFTYAVFIWGWLEMSYFMGLVTGPRKQPCPVGSSNWARFRLAVQVSLYHELAVVGLAALIVWLTWGQPNQVGTWTFLVLWWMRWSAKLNLFFGVPNLNEDWLPEHLRMLTSFIKKKPINLLFPISVTVATILVALLMQRALLPDADPFVAVSLTLIATLLALGILEHWFLVLPLADAALWKWAIRPEQTGHQGATEEPSDKEQDASAETGTSPGDPGRLRAPRAESHRRTEPRPDPPPAHPAGTAPTNPDT